MTHTLTQVNVGQATDSVTAKQAALRLNSLNGVVAELRQHDDSFRTLPFGDVTWHDVAQSRPARKFHAYKGRKHYDGLWWCATTEFFVGYESLHERAYLLTADADPAVVHISSQPLKVTGFDLCSDRDRSRIPDYLVTYADGSVELVDVTTPKRARTDRVQEASEWLRDACGLRGWRYRLWTGDDPVRLTISRMSLAAFLAAARQPKPTQSSSMVTGLDLLTTEERAELDRLVREIAWIIDPLDDAEAPTLLGDRVDVVAKARDESPRSVRRKLKTFRELGTNGLVSGDIKRRRVFRTDQRWTELARVVVGEHTRETTTSRKLLMERIDDRFLSECGLDPELPSQATKYRRLREIAKGAGTFEGTKRRVSTAESPKTAHGRMDITRPGQVIVLDSHRVDLMVVVPKSRLHEDIEVPPVGHGLRVGRVGQR